MTDDQQPTEATAQDSPAAQAKSPAPRLFLRRALRLLGLVLVVVVGLPLLAGGALWLRLASGPLALPDAITGRIEARLDGAMAANGVSIGRIEISRPADAASIDLALRELRLTAPDGTIRAAFPALVASLSLEALLQGRIEPLGVDLQGAGLRLARDAQGRIDLALVAGEEAAQVSLAETLARLDRMLASPVFSRLLRVQGRGLELVLADAVTGRTIRVNDAEMRLERIEGALALKVGGALEGSRSATIDIALSRAAEGGVTDLSFAFEGLAARDVAMIGPALAWVDLMRAPISGRAEGVLTDAGALGDLAVTLDIGPGHVRPAPDGAAIPFDALQSVLRYEAGQGRIIFERFDLAAPDLSFSASGHADLAGGDFGYVGQFRLADIRVARPELLPQPLQLSEALVEFRLGLAPYPRIEIGQAVIREGGLELSARGAVAWRPEGLDLALDLSVPAISAREVLAYWPATRLAPTRAWLDQALQEGELRGVDVALRAEAGGRLRHAVSFDFEAARLRVLPDLPPIEDGVGFLSIEGGALVLRLDRGRVTAPGGGIVTLDGSDFVVPDLAQRGPEARIGLAVDGGLTDVLRLLQAPPVRLFAMGAMTPERIGTGTARMQATITTRLMRQEGMGATRFSASGQVTGYAADALVPGRSLSAQSLDVAVDQAGIRVEGAALFNGLPLEGHWTRAFGLDAPRASRLEAETTITRQSLSTLGVSLPEWLVAGQIGADVILDLPDGAPPELSLVSDLAGARLALPPLGWRQGQGQSGRLVAEIGLGPVPEVRRIALAVDGLELEGRIALGAEGALERVTADRFRLGDWLDVTGALIARGQDRPAAIEITGGTLDLRGAPQSGELGAGPPGIGGGPITATLDRLQVTEGIAISPILADLTTQGGLSGQFRGRVNGQAQVSGTLISTQTGPAIRLVAEDGGDVLRSAGIFRSAFGGAMELILQATGAQGVYDGRLTISNPRLRDAPVLAEMLNVVSVVGLIDQLSGEGINMGAVEARFRVTPTELILTEGVAFGPALGLTLDGRYDLAARDLAMQGVVSPLNAINGVVGAIFSPRREGLFGFSYILTGNAESPQVTVNPLSILTPGVFRDIFRRPPPS